MKQPNCFGLLRKMFSFKDMKRRAQWGGGLFAAVTPTVHLVPSFPGLRNHDQPFILHLAFIQSENFKLFGGLCPDLTFFVFLPFKLVLTVVCTKVCIGICVCVCVYLCSMLFESYCFYTICDE